MFCRELCEVALFENREKLGGPGKVVQIDESKIGKRKYHRGHVVEVGFRRNRRGIEKVFHCMRGRRD